MRPIFQPARYLLQAAMACALAACGANHPDAVKVVMIGEPGSQFAKGSSQPQAARLLRSATSEGLVDFDEEGKVIPGLADRWIVTDDGRSYIFRLRDGTWPDGTPISGESARLALRQAIAAQRDAPFSLDLDAIDDVLAMAGRVVEIRLKQPMPDFLQLLAQPELGLIHRGKGAGPMTVKREGETALLTPIPPEKRGLPSVDGWADMVRPLSFTVMPGEDAMQAFARGKADVVLGGTFVDLPRVRRTALGKSMARFDPVLGLFGLIVGRSAGLLSTPQIREAIAMAIDRDSLASALGASGWTPTTRVVSPGVDGDSGLVGERWSDIDLDGRRTLALRRINTWVLGSHKPAMVSIALPDGPGADILFDRLHSDLAAISVNAVRVGRDEKADLRLVDLVARYPRSSWFFNRLSCRFSPDACSPEADALVAKAQQAPDAAGAATLLAQAETTLAQSNVFIPFGPPIRWSVVTNDLGGFATNRLGQHSLLPFSIRTK